MHITVEYKKITELLDLASRISTKHLTLPVLQCVLLVVKGNILTVKATNLEIGIEGVINVKQKEEGTAAIPASTLLSTIALMPQKDITLSLSGETLLIEGGNSKTKINTVPYEEFPNIPKLEKGSKEINGKVFALGIKTAAFAASQSSIKPELGSIYLHQKKEHTLTYVATDSFRLMEKTVPQQNLVLHAPILIPQKNALELARVCETLDDNPKVFITDNQLALLFESVYITSRLTTGNFPDYEQIIPKEYKTHATLLTKDLLLALKKTSIFLNKFMQLTLKVGKSDIVVSSQSGEVGNTIEKINASIEGEEITLNFNQRYIAEALPYIVDDSITLHFAGIGRPMVLESVHDRSIRYLVMPMNK